MSVRRVERKIMRARLLIHFICFQFSACFSLANPFPFDRRRRKMTKMSVEVASGPLVEVSDGKGKISPLPNQLIGPDHDHNQNQSCLTPSKKLSKSLPKKGKETKSNSQSSEVAVLLPGTNGSKNTFISPVVRPSVKDVVSKAS